MVVSLHDRISGHAGRVRVLDRFLTYAKGKEDVWFARKDEIARHALANRAATPVIDRGSPNVTGLAGSNEAETKNSENSKANRIETMKGPAESGQICSVGRRKVAKKIAKNKRCHANTLRPRSRLLLKVMRGVRGSLPPGSS
jgi:hypothetical protein